jgi:carboxypeptidase D
VANYPYDDSALAKSVLTPTPDDRTFVYLSYAYARAHPDMWHTACRCGLQEEGDFFYDGITNGAQWYQLAGKLYRRLLALIS